MGNVRTTPLAEIVTAARLDAVHSKLGYRVGANAMRTATVTSRWDIDRDNMRIRLRVAADHFSATLIGDATFGWRDRTIGSRVTTGDGHRWLRVSWSQTRWTDGDWWTGNQDAASLTGVPKPTVLDLYEWDENDDYWGECRNRAEVMTLVTDRPCSTTPELRSELEVPDRWWTDLRTTLDTLATHPTERGEPDQEHVTGRLLSFFGSGVDPVVTRWTTAHGDLNWTNLTQPNLVLLDWESWGCKIAGYDAASLYVLSDLATDTARKVHDTFADTLDSPDGIRAQLFVITRYLKRVEHGDLTDYADHLHQHARDLLDRIQ